MEVGFIGLGRMGRAMARNLLKAGHRVFVFNRTRSRAEELRDEGAEVADSPAGACKGDIVITMLADDNAVEEIVLGSGGIVKALRENAIHLSMSTITVALSEALTEAHYAVGQHFVAASGVRASGSRSRGKALHRRRRRTGTARPLRAAIRRPRSEDICCRSVPSEGQFSEAEREFSGRLGHRVPRRGRRADPQSGRRPDAVSWGRVEDWRAGWGRCISTLPRFQPPPRRTQHADFPHCAPPFASRRGLLDLSCRGDFRSVASHSIAVERP
jgi:hypothetical protein